MSSRTPENSDADGFLNRWSARKRRSSKPSVQLDEAEAVDLTASVFDNEASFNAPAVESPGPTNDGATIEGVSTESVTAAERKNRYCRMLTCHPLNP